MSGADDGNTTALLQSMVYLSVIQECHLPSRGLPECLVYHLVDAE